MYYFVSISLNIVLWEYFQKQNFFFNETIYVVIVDLDFKNL